MDQKTDHGIKLNPKVDSQIRLYLMELRRSRIAISKAFLFGSQATGKARAGSDIDICLVSAAFGVDYQAEMIKLLELAHQFELSMDVIPFHPRDLIDKYDPLAKEIRTHGIRIA